jgi:site-specific DNA recombinase
VPGAQLKDKIGGLEARKTELAGLLANSEELHPNMAEIYRQRISALYERLQSDDGRTEAAEVFRTLVNLVTLQPNRNELGVVLRGDLAAILSFAAGKRKPDLLSEARLPGDSVSPGSVVAGTRNTRLLRVVEQENPRLVA